MPSSSKTATRQGRRQRFLAACCSGSRRVAVPESLPAEAVGAFPAAPNSPRSLASMSTTETVSLVAPQTELKPRTQHQQQQPQPQPQQRQQQVARNASAYACVSVRDVADALRNFVCGSSRKQLEENRRQGGAERHRNGADSSAHHGTQVQRTAMTKFESSNKPSDRASHKKSGAALPAASRPSAARRQQARELMALLEPGRTLGDFSDFAKAYGDEAFCLRLLQKYSGNVTKCADKLRDVLVWREEHRELLTTRKFAQAGDYRVVGADTKNRPVLYQCMRNQYLPLGQTLDHQVVALLRAIDNMPPGVETATHIWDLHGMQLRLNLNPVPLVAMVRAAEGYFAERMQSLIIIDMPRMANFLKDAVWPLLPENTKAKVKFMTLEEAKKHLKGECDKQVASRIVASMEQNRDKSLSLEDRKRSWKRVDTHGNLVPAFD